MSYDFKTAAETIVANLTAAIAAETNTAKQQNLMLALDSAITEAQEHQDSPHRDFWSQVYVRWNHYAWTRQIRTELGNNNDSEFAEHMLSLFYNSNNTMDTVFSGDLKNGFMDSPLNYHGVYDLPTMSVHSVDEDETNVITDEYQRQRNADSYLYGDKLISCFAIKNPAEDWHQMKIKTIGSNFNSDSSKHVVWYFRAGDYSNDNRTGINKITAHLAREGASQYGAATDSDLLSDEQTRRLQTEWTVPISYRESIIVMAIAPWGYQYDTTRVYFGGMSLVWKEVGKQLKKFGLEADTNLMYNLYTRRSQNAAQLWTKTLNPVPKLTLFNN